MSKVYKRSRLEDISASISAVHLMSIAVLTDEAILIGAFCVVPLIVFIRPNVDASLVAASVVWLSGGKVLEVHFVDDPLERVIDRMESRVAPPVRIIPVLVVRDKAGRPQQQSLNGIFVARLQPLV